MDEYDRIDVEEAAEELGFSVQAVIRMCRDGVLDACPDTELITEGMIMRKEPVEGDDYWIERGEIARLQREGPRRRMGFDEAMQLLRNGKYVRRAAWPLDGLRWDDMAKWRVEVWEDLIKEFGVEHYGLICYYYVSRAYSADKLEAYLPTPEDRVAIDWVEYAVQH